ncbi:helix-turn-helix domain-containing protein [Paenibacillus sp. GM2]|uniref:helix-turn-helix domain-containing protein n=1 Tax=Paenibacillus sp. GM2 TaxID=1622070 RepID=UPI000839662E|nr:helix-turn-helix transcriptional regulator [Paenibacillus sp. GM2]
MGTKKVSLQEARKKKGLSYEEVAEKTGHSVRRIAWFEENPGELVADEAIELCNIYGVSLDDVTFSQENLKVYPLARNLTFTTSIMNQVSEILLLHSSDPEYAEHDIFKDLSRLLNDVQHENAVLLNVFNELARNKNHLNLSLAGR